MGQFINLEGQRFGFLTVIKRAENKNGRVAWLCKCDCGNEKIIIATNLRNKNTQSCGCYKGERISSYIAKENYLNQKFNSLTVIQTDNIKSHKSLFKCDCGNEKEILLKSVITGHTKSCGCLQKQNPNGFKNEIGNKYGMLTVVALDRIEDSHAHWLCKCDCGSEVVAFGYNLRNGSTMSCGCISSKGEYKIAQLLKEQNISFLKQFTFKDCIGVTGAPLRFDFAIFNQDESLSHLIEFDGQQHYQEVEYFGSNLESVQIRDNIKNEYCASKGIRLIRIKYNESLTLEKLL